MSPPLTRLGAWLKRSEQPATSAPEASLAEMRRQADRETIARVAQFMYDHDLSPTEEHFLLACRYVSGENRKLNEAVDARLRDGRAISADLVEEVSTDQLTPCVVIECADTLAASIAEGFRVLGQSCDLARDYGAALDTEMHEIASDPQAAVVRLVALTTASLERTRELSDRLNKTRKEAGRLRNRLSAARRAADEDHLTGLANRRSFDARLHLRPPADTGAAGRCVALCDIDDFKRINDRHGHDTGDRVLKLVARHLRDALGARVLVARHGGEEFACLFEGSTLQAARSLLDEARLSLAARNFVDQTSGRTMGKITFSAGIAAIDGNPRDAVRTADTALYAAKRAGKDRIEVARQISTAGMGGVPA